MDMVMNSAPAMFGRIDPPRETDYGIREVADMLDVSLRAIRFYEQKGLLSPRRDGRFRVYGPQGVEQLRFVQDFRKIGLTVREIKSLLADLRKTSGVKERADVIETYLDRRLQEIKLDIETLKDQERMAAAIKLQTA